VHEKGALTQSATICRSVASVSPTLVFFTATQKTNATKKTMSVYSTKPWPLVSVNRFLTRCIVRPIAPFGGRTQVMSKGNRRAMVWIDTDGVRWQERCQEITNIVVLQRHLLLSCMSKRPWQFTFRSPAPSKSERRYRLSLRQAIWPRRGPGRNRLSTIIHQ
jgi:hypothetical protein